MLPPALLVLVGGRITWLLERLPRAMGNEGNLALWAGVSEVRSGVAVWPL